MAPPPPKNKVMGCSFGCQPPNSIWKHLRFDKGLRIAWGSGTILPTNGRCATPLPGGWNCRCVADFHGHVSPGIYRCRIILDGCVRQVSQKKHHISLATNIKHIPPHFKPTKVCIFSSSFVIQKIQFQLVLIESTPGLWLFSPNFSTESEALIRDVHLSNEKKGLWLPRSFLEDEILPQLWGDYNKPL